MNLDKYKKIINVVLNNEVEDISFISNTSNMVFRVVKKDKEVFTSLSFFLHLLINILNERHLHFPS